MDQANLIGEKFGRWTVIDKAEPLSKTNRGRRWLCRCECGTERVVSAHSLINGTSKSCGCYHSDIMHDVGKVNTTHGMSSSRLYAIYKHMCNRCYNSNDARYQHYGARGIKICKEWQNFEPFMEWALSHGYDDNLSIDRIDNDGDYEPSNCRWATAEEQANNKSNCKLYTYQGETKNIAQWANQFNIPYKKLWKRLSVFGWDIEKAILAQ